MTAALIAAEPVAVASDVDPVHLACCCSEDIALCGEDLSGEPWTDKLDPPCPICFTLATGRCSRCGCVDDCGPDIHE